MNMCKIPLLLLAVLLCVTVAESWFSRPTRTRATCTVRPPRYRHLPATRCSRFSRVFRVKRQSKSYREERTDDEIRAEHAKLVGAGFVFIGWHGTTYDVGRLLVGGDTYRTTERTGTDRLWMGVWTSSNVERSVGYMTNDPVLLRVYIRLQHETRRSIFLDSADINNAVTTPFFCGHSNPSPAQMMSGDGRYVICGPDGAFGGQELIISREHIPNVRFRYSAHNRDIRCSYGCSEHRPTDNNIEVTTVDWSMGNINAFLDSLRRVNLFSNYRWHDELA